MGNVRMRAEQINYGASNVKVALDNLDPKDLIALSERMDAIEAWKATVKAEEKTGAEVTFTNALALAAVSLSAEVNAIQDLHGYGHPWAGGAGKNKLPLMLADVKALNTSGTWNGDTYTKNGISYKCEANQDGYLTRVTANGTSTAEAALRLLESSIDYPSGCIANGLTGGSSTTYLIEFVPSSYSGRTYLTNGDTVLINTNVFIVEFTVRSGVTLNNVVAQPMIRLSTESDASFAPYSNICPISGRTSVTITDVDAESQTATVTIQFGQTVYGGTLNATTGVLTITDVIEDMGNLTYSKLADYIFAASISDKAIGRTNFLSSQYAVVDSAWGSLANGQITGAQSSGYIHVKDERYNDENDFKTALTGQTICYELATPTTIQLTPTQLTMLKGYNRLSSDGGGDITVKAYTGAPWGGDEA